MKIAFTLTSLIVFLMSFSAKAESSTLQCSLKILEPNIGSSCRYFQKKDNYIPLITNWWDVKEGCDELVFKVGLENRRIGIAPYYKGSRSGRTTTIKTRGMVINYGEDTLIVNYFPAHVMNINPFTMIVDKTTLKGEFRWMYNYNGNFQYGPYDLQCSLND